MQPGDSVQWTTSSRQGRAISMTRHEGTLEAIYDGVATVRLKSGVRRNLPVSRVQPAGARGDLDRVMDAIRQNAKN